MNNINMTEDTANSVKLESVEEKLENEKWIDVTDTFKMAANSLSYQQPMIAHENFSLYEAMSAVEIMDPKMDQCATISSDASIEKLMDVKVPENTGVSHLISLIQCLVIYEVSFLQGASVLESTHQCIFLWEKSWDKWKGSSDLDIHVSIIIGYCKSLNKSLHYLNRVVLDADVYEDEDFQPISSGCLANVEDEYVTQILTDCMNLLQSKLSEPNSKNILLSKCLQLRLSISNLCKALFQLLHDYITSASYYKRNQTPVDINQCKLQLDSFIKTIKSCQVDLESMKTAFNNDGIDDVSSHHSLASIQFAFSIDLVRLSQSHPSPVRDIKFNTFYQSIKYLENVLKELSQICTYCNKFFSDYSNMDFDSILQVTAQTSRQNIHLLPRSLFKACIEVLSSKMTSIVFQSMSNRYIPSKYLETEVVAQKWSPVISNLAYETLRILTQSRSKLLSRLDGILGSWGVITSEAPYIDRLCLADIDAPSHVDTVEPVNDWFSCWVLTITTHLMDIHMELLIEMDLLSLIELDYFYWYWDYVCSSRTWAMQRLRTLQFENAKIEFDKLVKEKEVKNKNYKKGKKKSESVPDVGSLKPPTPLLPTAEELSINAKGQICRGQLRMMFLIQALELIDRVEVPHTSWTKKFEQRFRAFQNIPNPPMLSFSTFQNVLNSGDNNTSFDEKEMLKRMDPVTIAETASSCFGKGRQFLDTFREIQGDSKRLVKIPVISVSDEIAKESSPQLLKAAIANSVNSLKISKQVSARLETPLSNKNCKVLLNKSHSLHFPVIEVKLVG